MHTVNLKDARATIHYFRDRELPILEIELAERVTTQAIAKIKFTPEQWFNLISGLGYTKCLAKVDLDAVSRIGKKMQMAPLTFEMPDDGWLAEYRKKIARKLAKEKCPDGWEPDLHFGSQGSFFNKEGKSWARTTIRRWVTPEEDADV